MGRQPCCEKAGLKRGPWTVEEDAKLMNFILHNGIKCWRLVPKLAGLMRCGKSCRLRWINYLRPDLKRGALTEAEEDMIIELHSRLGNRWSKIASHFPGRTDNEIKNHWNTRIKKKMKLMGLDPVTHNPIGQEIITRVSDDQEDSDQKKKIKCEGSVVEQSPGKECYHLQQFIAEDTYAIGSRGSNEAENKVNNVVIGSPIMFQGADYSMETYQNWVDNPFIWDGFSSFNDSFP